MARVSEPVAVRPALRLLGVGITNRCNLTCEYCSRSSGPWDHTDLSLDTLKGLLQDATSVAVSELTIAITGGEPALHPEFPAVLDLVRQFTTQVSLNSNGVLLGGEVVSLCLKRDVASFSVSIDGSQTTYRRVRGDTREIDVIERNLRALVAAGGRVFMSCAVTKDNVDDIDGILDLAESVGARGISLARVYPIGRALWNRPSLFLGWSRFMEAALRARRRASMAFVVDIEENLLQHLWDPAQARRSHQVLAESGGRTWSGAAAAVTMAHVEASGNVLPDPFLGVCAGNIYEESFASVWYHSRVMNDLRRRDRLLGACGACEDKLVCGGSRARAFGTYGNYYAEDPGCPRSAGGGETLLFESALPIVAPDSLIRARARVPGTSSLV